MEKALENMGDSIGAGLMLVLDAQCCGGAALC
jgi:hypothetical protein